MYLLYIHPTTATRKIKMQVHRSLQAAINVVTYIESLKRSHLVLYMPTANKHFRDIANLDHVNDGINEQMDQRQWRILYRSVFAAVLKVHTARFKS